MSLNLAVDIIYSGTTTASDITLDSNTAETINGIGGYGGALYMGEIYSTDTPSQSTWDNLNITNSSAYIAGGICIRRHTQYKQLQHLTE